MFITLSGISTSGKTTVAEHLNEYIKRNSSLKTKPYWEHEFKFPFEKLIGDSTHRTILLMEEAWNIWGAIPVAFQLSYLYNTEIHAHDTQTVVMLDCYLYEYLQTFMHHQEIEKIIHVGEFLKLPMHNDQQHKHFYLDVPLTLIQQRQRKETHKPVNLDYERHAIRSYRKLCELNYLIEIDASGSYTEIVQQIGQHLEIYNGTRQNRKTYHTT